MIPRVPPLLTTWALCMQNAWLFQLLPMRLCINVKAVPSQPFVAWSCCRIVVGMKVKALPNLIFRSYTTTRTCSQRFLPDVKIYQMNQAARSPRSLASLL